MVGDTFQLVATVGPVLSYSDNGVTPDTNYIYRIFAINIIGYSPISPWVSASTFVGTVPSQPQNLVAATISSTQIDLTWDAPASDGGQPITNYKIVRKVVGGIFQTVATVGPVLSFSDNGLTPDTNYIYKVYAINSIGQSPTSPWVSPVRPAIFVTDNVALCRISFRYELKELSHEAVCAGPLRFWQSLRA